MGKGRRLFLHGRPNVAGDLNFFCRTLSSLQLCFSTKGDRNGKLKFASPLQGFPAMYVPGVRLEVIVTTGCKLDYFTYLGDVYPTYLYRGYNLFTKYQQDIPVCP